MDLNESWIQIIGLFLANASLILWFRAESRADWRHMDNKMESMSNKFDASIRAIHEEVKSMNVEMKDFHGRLISLEERSRKKEK